MCVLPPCRTKPGPVEVTGGLWWYIALVHLPLGLSVCNYISGCGCKPFDGELPFCVLCPFPLSVSRVRPDRPLLHRRLQKRTNTGRCSKVVHANGGLFESPSWAAHQRHKDDDSFRWLVKSSLLPVPHGQRMFSVYKAHEKYAHLAHQIVPLLEVVGSKVVSLACF